MKGRLENEIKLNNHTKELLKELPDYVTSYYMHIQSSRSANTCSTYVKTVKRFLEFTKNDDLSKMDEDTVQEFLESIKYVERNGKMERASVSYTKLTCSALSSFFQFAYRKKLINNNPMEYVDRPLRKDYVHRPKLTMEDLQNLLDCVRWNWRNGTHFWMFRDYTIIYLFIVTGMRLTAMSEINVEDYDPKTGNLTITDKRDKEHVYILPKETKRVLEGWISRRGRYLERKGFQSDAMFISEKRGRLASKSIYELVTYYTEIAFGEKYSPHKLRAAFISLYYDQTHDIEAVREAVGHASVVTTGRYITKENNPRKEAAEFMAEGVLGMNKR